MTHFRYIRLAIGVIAISLFQTAVAVESARLQLRSVGQVDGSGVFLDQLLQAPADQPLPHVRVAVAPAWGQALVFSTTQVVGFLQQHAPDVSAADLTGAPKVRVTRRARQLDEPEFKQMLTTVLQRDTVKDKGELELRLARPWAAVVVPDEALVLKVIDLPAGGLGGNCVLRVELICGEERVGNWQLVAQARVWRDVPVAQSTLKRGQLLRDADITRERRDVLVLREALQTSALEDGSLEIAEVLQAGQPLLSRSVRIKPAVLRGRVVEALILEGTMTISMKVEALEDGLPGQRVRVRNPKTKREFFGKVQDEQTIVVNM
ncbi:MAG: flagellar basal body P-ring formation protein FlgA [Pedosphaera sp.]|nr:flagellar basal body P-ring formation protein FlgA [Pedosphaera sp.]